MIWAKLDRPSTSRAAWKRRFPHRTGRQENITAHQRRKQKGTMNQRARPSQTAGAMPCGTSRRPSQVERTLQPIKAAHRSSRHRCSRIWPYHRPEIRNRSMPAHARGYMGRGGMKGTSYQGKTSNDSRARLKKAHAMDPHRHRRENRSIKRFLVREKGRETGPGNGSLRTDSMEGPPARKEE